MGVRTRTNHGNRSRHVDDDLSEIYSVMLLEKKFYIIAGEASGDLHAANMIRAMREVDPHCTFRFWGGDNMIEATQNKGFCIKHIRELAFMGFAEVVRNLRTIFSNIALCKNDIENYQPDALILIDYPGFNLRIAKWAKKRGLRVFYYISPQVWAWKKGRVHTIKKVVDRMYVILPFEQQFYKELGMDVVYVGHPLIDAIEDYRSKQQKQPIDLSSDRPVIAVLPGSRKQEIKKKLPIMLAATQQLSEYQIIVAGAPNIERSYYDLFLSLHSNVSIVYSQTYDLLAIADLAVVTSGTATLETALFEVPEVVCYIGSPLSYIIARRLIKIPYISLVNLIMGREIVKELIQKKCTPQTIATELQTLLPKHPKRLQMLNDYRKLHQKLGHGGASKNVALDILQSLDGQDSFHSIGTI